MALSLESRPPSPVVALLTASQKLVLLALVSVVLSASLALHQWLLPRLWEFGQGGGWPALLAATCYLGVCMGTLDALTSLLLLIRAKKVNDAAPPPRFRVAMIATKVPSEPLSMLQETLGACLAQDYPYPYDVWLADEDPDADTKAWCAEHGVRISCRKGVEAYHRAMWPRRTRCKEGNLAYFYDQWGYRDYDVVAQFDADHVPAPNYLSTSLPAFLDDSVGYCALPSICGANEKDCGWVVRMRLFAEGIMHGSQGASFSDGWLPCCIGSHYIVRTKALKAVGGIGPELDEDMSTSIIMSASGYKGVFAINTIANGDGPASFEDSMYQEYQWARSAAFLFLQYLPPYFAKAGLAVKFRYIHIVMNWLVSSAMQTLAPALLLGMALATRTGEGGNRIATLVPSLANPSQPGVLYAAQLGCAYLMLASWINRNGWMRPADTPVISWEAMLHVFCRVLFTTKGLAHGMYSYFAGKPLNIRVTPKGPQGERFMPLSVISPFCVSAGVLAAAGLANPGFVLLVTAPAVTHVFVACLLVALHYRDHHSLRSFPTHNFLTLAAPIATAAALVAAMLKMHGAIVAGFVATRLSPAALHALATAHPATFAYTCALAAGAGVALSLSRRTFFTPLRTHRRGKM